MPQRRPRIVDACLLFNEVDLLEIRLGELWDSVDRFVVVESDRSFAGAPKPFFFEDHAERFARFSAKITYFKFIDPNPRPRMTTRERLAAEALQRNALCAALETCNLAAGDIVIVADVDEIPRPAALPGLARRLLHKPFAVFEMRNLRGYLNNTSSAALNGAIFAGAVACRWGTCQTIGAQAVRFGENRAGHVLAERNPAWDYIAKGGWHLSSMGGAEAFWVKAQNFAHAEDPHRVIELAGPSEPIRAFTGALTRAECAAGQRRYLEHATEARFSPLAFDAPVTDGDLPAYLAANHERFRRYFFFTDILPAGSRGFDLGPQRRRSRHDRRGAAVAALVRSLARLLLRPGLGRPLQYSPRPLRNPRSYRRYTIPPEAPVIAIVTPSFNQGRFIDKTIESVLGQEYPRLRYRVQDGGSTDGTHAILAGFGSSLDWTSEPDAGQADAINRGFACIEGDVMAWINSDDLLLPGALAAVAQAFARHPEIDLVYGHRIFIDPEGQETGRMVLPPHDPAVLAWQDYVPQESLFWRSRVWRTIGPLDTSFQFALDWDFLLRADSAGFVMRRIPRFLGCFRQQWQQKSSAIGFVGEREIELLRTRTLRRATTPLDVSRATRPYRLRQAARQWAWRLGLMR